MATDTLVLLCPQCNNQFPVSTYSGTCEEKSYGIGNAPLSILAEVNESSKKGEIGCIHCGLTIYLQILYLPYVRPMSEVEFEQNGVIST